MLIDEPVVFYLVEVYESVLNSKNIGDWGAFGDFWGGLLNPIFSFISIILIIYTVVQQGKAIEQTSTQIQLSMKEVTKSVEAQQEQVHLNRKQFDYVTKQAVINEVYTLIKYACEDFDNQLKEKFTCYKDVAACRALKDQLIEVNSKENAAKDEFLTEYGEKYKQLKQLFDFISSQIQRLVELGDEEGYRYFNSRLDGYKLYVIKKDK